MEHNRTQHSILKINRYSFGIALPKWMARKLELEAGERVDLKFDEDNQSIVISKSANDPVLKPAPRIEDDTASIAPAINPAPAGLDRSQITQTTPMEAELPTKQVEPNNLTYDDSDVIPLPEL